MVLGKKFFAFSQPIENFFKFGDKLHFAWKDLNSAFLGCSDFLGEESGLTPSNLIGLTDRDLIWGSRADQYRKDEEMVLNSRSTRFIYEPLKTVEGEVSLITFKTPLISSSGLIEGIFAVAFALEKNSLLEVTKLINYLGILTPDKMLSHLSDQTITKHLSKREQECLFYLTQGKGIKEIAKLLTLSPRTIETHIDNIKSKLHCHSRSSLISKVMDPRYSYEKIDSSTES
ncbi:MAG: LuxR C-terminal-related transcriptional regulator [Gammaproteobacteria bacterium]|nr:LuxR C-terminal-related transcriptional regulator [Gammaproteobacteria bacterium]